MNAGILKSKETEERRLAEGARIFTVDELTKYIKNLLESDKRLNNIWVKAEISNFTKHSSGHMYFSLKDENAVLSCAMFKNQNESLSFEPAHGMKIIARGSISVYAPKGNYQLIVEEMLPEGQGELHMKFLQLKEKLHKEGLFLERHKKPLPKYPEKIGIVTSISGAAIRDIMKIIKNRYPAAEILIAPATVQGDGASSTIIEAIEILNTTDVDVIIVGRGGGSLEDLWAFNEECLARAIFNSKIPIITGIGHEKDFTIADMVADYYAPTPSGAAERVVPDKHDVLDILFHFRKRLCQNVIQYLGSQRKFLQSMTGRPVFNRPFDIIFQCKQQVDDISCRLDSSFSGFIKTKGQRIHILENKLLVLNPKSVLRRGYSITMKGDKIIRTAKEVETNIVIRTVFHDGEVESQVKGVKEGKDAR